VTTIEIQIQNYSRRHAHTTPLITVQELELGCRKYKDQEPRDSMYRVSRFLVREWWTDHEKLTDALSVLLLTWNVNFYRFGGGLIAEDLERSLRDNWATVEAFYQRRLSTLQDVDRQTDHQEVAKLFSSLSTALRRVSNEIESPSVVRKPSIYLLLSSFQFGINSLHLPMTVPVGNRKFLPWHIWSFVTKLSASRMRWSLNCRAARNRTAQRIGF
jgi:hypothetical protein